MESIVVIGGGVAGCCTAIRLAEKGHKVTLLEKNKLLSGTSCRTPGRMGLGFHYSDIDTAVLYLQSTVAFTKKYAHMRVGEDLDYNHKLRHGRYLICKDSIQEDLSIDKLPMVDSITPSWADSLPLKKHIDPDLQYKLSTILTCYDHLKREYERLVMEDPTNEVYGPPSEFYKILKPEEFIDDVNTDLIALGIETQEHLLNFDKFEKFIRKEMIKKKIKALENTEVIGIQHGSYNKKRFIVVAKNTRDKNLLKIKTNYVVNSTYECIEQINALVGIPMSREKKRTNRLKVILHVDLPQSLIETNSMFFCMGTYCMFSNMGHGKAMMTYAPVTNIDTSSDLNPPAFMVNCLAHGAGNIRNKKLGEDILKGVTRFIPAMKDAVIRKVGFGIVQTLGDYNTKSLGSDYHKRAYYNVRSEQLGWFSNPATKLMYCAINPDLIADHLTKQITITSCIQNVVKEALKKYKLQILNLNGDVFNDNETKINFSVIGKAILVHFEKAQATKIEGDMNQNSSFHINTEMLLAHMLNLRQVLQEIKNVKKNNAHFTTCR